MVFVFGMSLLILNTSLERINLNCKFGTGTYIETIFKKESTKERTTYIYSIYFFKIKVCTHTSNM